MRKVNPYRPGAGQMPVFLAGREKNIQEFTELFEALLSGIPVRSVMYSGLRGVGKTVLLNKLESIADERGIFQSHIEIEDNKDFIMQLAATVQKYLRENSMSEEVKDLREKVWEGLKTLVVTYNPGTNLFSLSLHEKEYYITTDLGQAFTDLFVKMGELARKINKPVCFFVDEIQYIKPEELSGLIVAIHRCNQLGLPVMVIGCGLPKIYKMLSDIKSYSERLFIYYALDGLDERASMDAIINPVKDLGVSYTDDAVKKIIDETKGYPFFIQQLCELLFNNTSGTIKEIDVEASMTEYYRVLDEGFYKVRYSRCSDKEKIFVRAMVQCGELPCTIANVAANMHASVQSISPTRGHLINKGIIYPVRHSELDFTVPEFDKYILRAGGEV